MEKIGRRYDTGTGCIPLNASLHIRINRGIKQKFIKIKEITIVITMTILDALVSALFNKAIVMKPIPQITYKWLVADL